MKKLIRKIQMWWWKKHNPERYFEEYWSDFAKRFADGCKRATLSLAALTKVLNEQKDDLENGEKQ